MVTVFDDQLEGVRRVTLASLSYMYYQGRPTAMSSSRRVPHWCD